MGVQLEEVSSAIVSVVLGGLLCAVGLFVLRCRFRAAIAGLALYGLALISGVLSAELWPSWVAADVVARREYQVMQKLAPVVVAGAPALMCLWLAAAGRRFSRGRWGVGRPAAADDPAAPIR
jgi:hypothetical protein